MYLSECEPLILDLIRLMNKFEGGQPTVMTWGVEYINYDVTLPSVEDGDYDFVVDWGDGTPVQRNIFEHHFEECRNHRVTITGKFHGLSFHLKTGRERLTSIAWGSKVKLVPAQGRHFQECSRLETFTGIPNIIGVTDMSKMFYGCKQFNGELSKWDTSNVTDMELMFGGCWEFNGDLSKWDTSSVTDMSKMFGGCHEFNGDLSNWNTSDVTNMSQMFIGCINFNGNISEWDTSNVQNMSQMFTWCQKFNGDLSKWDTSNVTNMSRMFEGCGKFNGDLSKWDTSSVTDMSWMFIECDKFNGDLSNWDISNVQHMSTDMCAYRMIIPKNSK